MGWVAGSELCTAVTNAGGLGMIALPRLPAPALGTVLGKLAQACDGPFGVNSLVPFLDDGALEVAAERGPVVGFFYSDPGPVLVERARPANGAVAGWFGRGSPCCRRRRWR
ncbi:MAG: nitronate monooxygenase [Actinomycetota bacterium]